jgi:hypothetical protein
MGTIPENATHDVRNKLAADHQRTILNAAATWTPTAEEEGEGEEDQEEEEKEEDQESSEGDAMTPNLPTVQNILRNNPQKVAYLDLHFLPPHIRIPELVFLREKELFTLDVLMSPKPNEKKFFFWSGTPGTGKPSDISVDTPFLW